MKMTSERKIRANRANAGASTGPKTAQGRTRSARNALRHALSLPVYSDQALCAEAEALAGEIAGPDANAEMRELARRVAEAQVDLRRVRCARHRLLSRAAPGAPIAGLEYVTTTPEGSHNFGNNSVAGGSTALGLGPV